MRIRGKDGIAITNEETVLLAQLAGIDLREPELSDVRYRLLAIFEVAEEIEGIFGDSLDHVDPIPVLLPQEVKR